MLIAASSPRAIGLSARPASDAVVSTPKPVPSAPAGSRCPRPCRRRSSRAQSRAEHRRGRRTASTRFRPAHSRARRRRREHPRTPRARVGRTVRSSRGAIWLPTAAVAPPTSENSMPGDERDPIATGRRPAPRRTAAASGRRLRSTNCTSKITPISSRSSRTRACRGTRSGRRSGASADRRPVSRLHRGRTTSSSATA